MEIAWWYEILPHLFGLQRHFTTYQLEQASALRSVHSWNLLKLLMRFESTGWAEYAIEDFAVSMEATEKQRANFAKIRTKIIEPAVTELVQKRRLADRLEADQSRPEGQGDSVRLLP